MKKTCIMLLIVMDGILSIHGSDCNLFKPINEQDIELQGTSTYFRCVKIGNLSPIIIRKEKTDAVCHPRVVWYWKREDIAHNTNLKEFVIGLENECDFLTADSDTAQKNVWQFVNIMADICEGSIESDIGEESSESTRSNLLIKYMHKLELITKEAHAAFLAHQEHDML